jgi:hypothetical protein
MQVNNVPSITYRSTADRRQRIRDMRILPERYQSGKCGGRGAGNMETGDA